VLLTLGGWLEAELVSFVRTFKNCQSVGESFQFLHVLVNLGLPLESLSEEKRGFQKDSKSCEQNRDFSSYVLSMVLSRKTSLISSYKFLEGSTSLSSLASIRTPLVNSNLGIMIIKSNQGWLIYTTEKAALQNFELGNGPIGTIGRMLKEQDFLLQKCRFLPDESRVELNFGLSLKARLEWRLKG